VNDFYDPNEGLNELYAEDPARATALIAQAVAQQVLDANQGQMLHQAWQVGASQAEGIVRAQSESAMIEADRALARKYTDWATIRPEIGAYVEQHPDMLPDDILVSPQALADRLDDLAKLVRQDAHQREERKSFDRIKAAGTGTYQDLVGQRRETAE
jgi:hypothetical protein